VRHANTTALVALAAIAGLVVPVQGGSISGTISGDSSLTPAAPAGAFVQSFKGNGDDTILGAFTSISQSLIDFSKSPAIVISSGAFFEVFSGGTLFGTSSGSGTANGNGTARVTIDFVFTGGTGLFAGATGEATLTGTITSTSSATESITGSYVGTLSVGPEPTTLAVRSRHRCRGSHCGLHATA
jgi:hypothetical protein